MASKDLETRLIATDKASKVIEQVADDLDRLEKKGDVEVELTAKDKASDDIRELDHRLAGLSDEDKTIVLRAQAKDAQRDIDRILRSLRDVDKVDDETVKIRIQALGDARAELKQIQEQTDKLDKEKIDIPVDVDNRTTSKFSQLKTDLAGAETGIAKIGVLGRTAFANLSTYAVPALATAGIAVGKFVTDATSDFTDLGLAVGKMRDTLGIPAEAASRLKEVADDIGAPVETITKIIGRMNIQAANSPEKFAGMNAAIVHSADGSTDVLNTFLSVIDALNRIPDAAARAAAGQAIFGKGWGDISELVIEGTDQIRKNLDDIDPSQIMNDEAIAKAREMRDTMDDLGDKLHGISLEAGEALLPVMVSLAQEAEAVLGPIIKVAKIVGNAQKATEEKKDKPNFLEGLRDTALKMWPAIIRDAKHHADVIQDAFGEATKGSIKGVNAAGEATQEWTLDLKDAADQAEAFKTATNTALAGIQQAKDPLGTLPDQWKILMDDMRDGKIDTEAALTAMTLLGDALDLTGDQVLGIAQAELDTQMEDAAAAAEQYQQAVADIAGQVADVQTGLADWRTTIDEATVSAAGMMDSFDAAKVDAVTTALGDFLAVRQPGVGWLDTLGATQEALGDIFSQIKDNEGAIPDIFETGTEKGRDFRDAIDQASQQVNDRLVEALKNAGGDFEKVREQADALREAMVKKIEMRTGLSMDVPAERTRILGLVNAVVPTDKQIKVGIALAKEDLAKLKAQLAIESLQSLLPKTALQLQVDLAEGDITPEEAAATAQKVLNETGVNVDLDVNTKKADDDLVTFAKKERDTAMGVVIPDKQLVGAAGTILAGPGGQGWPPIHIPVIPVLPDGSTYTPAAGFGPRSATPAGLAATPTAATTTGAATAVPVHVAAAAPQVTIETHLHAAVIGSPFDVMRAVDTANRRAARLLPKVM